MGRLYRAAVCVLTSEALALLLGFAALVLVRSMILNGWLLW